MTNPIPDLQVGDVVLVADSAMVCCQKPRDDGYGGACCCNCPIEEDRSYLAIVETEGDCYGWRNCDDIISITRRVVVDGVEQEVKIWERA